jgi:hypothetical protein
MSMLGAAVEMSKKVIAIAALALRWFHDHTALVNWYS